MKYLISLNGKDYEVEVDREEAVLLSVTDTPAIIAAAPVVPVPAVGVAPYGVAPISYTGEPVTSPLPGMVLHVAAKPGVVYKQGDLLVVIEAMKMENDVLAPRDCTISSVFCKDGDTVQTDALLLTIL